MNARYENSLRIDMEASIACREEAEKDKDNILGFRAMFLENTEFLIKEGKRIIEQGGLSEDELEYLQTITAFYEQQLQQFNAKV